jgi:hypothetical protein
MIPPPSEPSFSVGLSRRSSNSLEVRMPVRAHRISGVRPRCGPLPMAVVMLEVFALPTPVAGRGTAMVMAVTWPAPISGLSWDRGSDGDQARQREGRRYDTTIHGALPRSPPLDGVVGLGTPLSLLV